ncbi:MAG: hypothetical protein KatS3mg015_2940 [Fimbriimonadales bacterium]|nr:MAG: hypothetical protein KatS3mg015_2940 [Fimbriimonadales bacterium]
MATETPRQRLIATILKKASQSSVPVAFAPSPALRAAVDSLGWFRRTADDGFDEIDYDIDLFLAQAIEAAIVDNRPQLIRAIYSAERDRLIARSSVDANSLTSQAKALTTLVTNITGTTLQ